LLKINQSIDWQQPTTVAVKFIKKTNSPEVFPKIYSKITCFSKLTAQYRLEGSKVCEPGVSTCRNKCPGSFISENLAKRCDLKSRCPVIARSARERDSCSTDPEPLAILYTCNGKITSRMILQTVLS
jgi:hypothetical protein